MNGIPVSPERKTENAPTWRSPNPLFWTWFWPYFLLISGILSSHSSHTHHKPTSVWLLASSSRYIQRGVHIKLSAR